MMEEYFKSVFGERAEEVANRENREEVKRNAEDDGADGKKARAEVEQRGVKETVTTRTRWRRD
jgi:hypothetical protein